MVHRIDAVGSDVHLEQVPVAGTQMMHALDRNATEGQVVCQLPVRDGKCGQVIAEPFGENVHDQQVSKSASQRACFASFGFRDFRRPLIIRATSLQRSLSPFA